MLSFLVKQSTQQRHVWRQVVAPSSSSPPLRARTASTLALTRTATTTTTTTMMTRTTTCPSWSTIRTFASAVPKNNHAKTKRRTFDTTEKDPIFVTDRAAARIQDLLQHYQDNHPGQPSPRGIRLGVRRRGCNGLSYTLNYVYDTPEDQKTVARDVTMECPTFQLFIEPMALFNIVGTTMDWEETELSSEFTFSNPNSKGECGCGESFTV
mmetsp:Transcript_17776/g.33499  ORF Transcript_17776/g.33499 Transcript_17776/m.33499 type:complete len:210 (-) Transcript_17776:217-846(-)